VDHQVFSFPLLYPFPTHSPFSLCNAALFEAHCIKYPEERIHFVEYAVLGVLLYFALREGILGRRLILYIPALVFIIGLGDELIQGILPNRVYDFRDVLMNLAGGILGELILISFNLKLIKGKKSVSCT
jgi:VanZ family protein